MEVVAEKIFKEIIDEKFPNLMKMSTQSQETPQNPEHRKYEYSYTKARNNKNVQK